MNPLGRLFLVTSLLIPPAALLLIVAPRSVPAAEPATLSVTSAEFLPDRAFPGLYPYIRDGYDLKIDMRPEVPAYDQIVQRGATLRVFLRNASGAPRGIDAVLLNGIDLAQHILPIHREHRGLRAASHLLNDDSRTPPAVKQRLDALGAPIWYRVRPNPIPPGGFTEVTIRLRTIPTTSSLEISVRSAPKDENAAQNAATEKGAAQNATKVDSAGVSLHPQLPSSFTIASVSFNAATDRAFVYLRNQDGDDFTLRSIAVDGTPVDLSADAPRTSFHRFLPVEIPLPTPWAHGSLHHLAATTTRGETAAIVLRARDDFFALGLWGYRRNGNTDEEQARDTVTAFHDHLFNTHMGMMGPNGSFLRSEAGWQFAASLGIRMMPQDPVPRDIGNPNLYARFLLDEPDAHEAAIDALPGYLRLGAYAQGLVERQRQWTEDDPRGLTLLNVDLTYKPENWLVYGPLPDILACDPYYQMRLADTYQKHPGWLGRNSTPYYVFAIADVARWGAEPNPLHIILNSVSYRGDDFTFRYGTPEEKRIEFYYALAAGAKGISYWWFTPYGTYKGCGADEPGAKAMLAELGRLNAEARSILPLLARSHPVAVGGDKSEPFATALPFWLKPRTLIAGTDTALVVLVNRDHASDRVGTLYEPIPKATITFDVPPWLQPVEAFRLTRDGVAPASFTRDEEGRLVSELRDVQLTEILVLTERRGLQAETARRWEELNSELPDASN